MGETSVVRFALQDRLVSVPNEWLVVKAEQIIDVIVFAFFQLGLKFQWLQRRVVGREKRVEALRYQQPVSWWRTVVDGITFAVFGVSTDLVH